MGAVSRMFVWGTDETLDSTGWLAANKANNMEGYRLVPGFLASESLSIAHDVIEHYNWPTEHDPKPHELPIPCEMMALGQVAYIRRENGEVRRGAGNPGTGASDIASAFRDIMSDEVVPACPVKVRAFDWFADHMAGIRRNIEHEMRSYYDIKEDTTDQNEKEQFAHIMSLVPNALDWYMFGYRRAVARWARVRGGGSCPGYYANDLFWQMADGLAGVTGDEGDKLIVHFNVSSLTWGHRVKSLRNYY